MFKNYALLFPVFYFLISCNGTPEGIGENEQERFVLLDPGKSGITFKNEISSTPELNILTYLYYYNGAGVAAGDFNNNGLQDLYFVSNQAENKLYINKGDLIFEDLTMEAGLQDEKGWSTGVTTVDINHDGLLDIYVSKVGDYKSLKGKNKLFVNQGISPEGVPVFRDEASKYNLDIVSFSTQAAFFDFDADGDLDMFLLNHSVHPNRNYGSGNLRKIEDSLSGDRLYRNDEGKFTDISKDAGIYQGKIGYGLGLAVSDVNNDGYPDIYVGNDFFENDYLYINQGNGIFNEIITSGKSGVNHTSHYSMGVDIADFNNDGLTDILSLDMLPEDLTTYKSSGTDYSYTINNQYVKNEYFPQYMQNALQLNQGKNHFSEIAHLAGVAATEWSWAPLFADFDNDGLKDIFISNGILGATNDMDFISFIANENIQRRLSKGMSKEDLKFIEEIPEKKTTNYFFKNTNGLHFKNVSEEWSCVPASFSNGAIYVDLDDDGDLDIVVNNINSQAFIYENRTGEGNKNNFLKAEFKGSEKNPFGIGAKVIVYQREKIQIAENYPSRGYLSSVSPLLHFGLGNSAQVDSMEVVWPDQKSQILRKPGMNQTIIFDYSRATENLRIFNPSRIFFENVPSGIPYRNSEYETKDFYFEPLTPYAVSNEGPSISVFDFNGNGLDDVFSSGSKYNPGKLMLQNADGSFMETKQAALSENLKNEPADQVFFDANNNGDLDLLIVFGGNELYDKEFSTPKFYSNENGILEFQPDAFPQIEMNASVCVTGDFNNDGYQDVFVGSNSVFGTYGRNPESYLYINDGNAKFTDQTLQFSPELRNLGQIYDAKAVDLNQDGYVDLVVAGHYLPISFFINDGAGKFVKKEISDSSGWWNNVELADFDKDGDLDIIAGNWGFNSRLKASVDEPICLYLQDFDDNNKIDPIVTYFYQGRETPIATKDELSAQIPMLKKKFLSYSSFAKADFKDYFDVEKIRSAEKKIVVTLKTTYFENTGDLKFKVVEIPDEAQFSPVHSIVSADIDGDGQLDVILGGNSYEINTQLGRQDASFGLVLRNNGKGKFVVPEQRDFYISGAVRNIVPITIGNDRHFIFGVNNDSLKLIKLYE